MHKLTVGQIISMHSQLIMATGGSDGIRDKGLLESAVNAPFQSFGGWDVYPTIYEKAARLGFGLAQNHAFSELFSMFMRLAESEATFEELVSWLMDHETDSV